MASKSFLFAAALKIGLVQDILTVQTKSKIEFKLEHILNLIWTNEEIK